MHYRVSGTSLTGQKISLLDLRAFLVLALWSSLVCPPPTSPDSHCQRAWDAPRMKGLYQSLLESSPDPTTRARLLAVATKEAGAWLNALPVPSLGLHLDNEVVRIAVGLRLSLSLCRPHLCNQCGSDAHTPLLLKLGRLLHQCPSVNALAALPLLVIG